MNIEMNFPSGKKRKLFYIRKNLIVFIGKPVSDFKKHFGASYFLCVNCKEGTSKFIESEKINTAENSFLFCPGGSRNFTINSEMVFCIIAKPYCIQGEILRNRMKGKEEGGLYTDINCKDSIVFLVNEFLSGKSTIDEVIQKIDKLLFVHEFEYNVKNIMSRRIEKATNYIDKNLSDAISIKEIGNIVGLSESRLQHLFKEKTGITIGQYIAWGRICLSCRYIIQGNKVTISGLLAGFNHSTQFSHVFKRLYGFPITSLANSLSEIEIKGLEKNIDDWGNMPLKISS